MALRILQLDGVRHTETPEKIAVFFRDLLVDLPQSFILKQTLMLRLQIVLVIT